MERFSLKTIRADRADLLQTDTWPEVDERTLVNPEARKIFETRREAILLMMADLPKSEILAKTGIPGTELGV